MVAIGFGLASAALWGLADYLGGVKSRTFPVPVVLAASYLTSLIVMGLFVGARGEGPPETSAVLAALGAGIVGIAGLSAFYRGLAIGTMSIVAPIASTGVCIPVLVGLAGGDQPGVVRSIGLALAVVGIVCASREDDATTIEPGLQRRSIGLALIAAVGFGSYFVLADIGASGDVGWSLLLSRVSALPLIGAFAYLALRRGAGRPRGRELLALVGLGLTDLAANACYNHATTIGELSSVSVASSLYPVMTVALAAFLLGERVQGVQRVGVAVALCGVVMIAAG